MSTNFYDLPNTGFLITELTDAQLAPILTEIDEIQKDFLNATKANYGLVGNIRKEFSLVKSHGYIEELLKEYVQQYENKYKYLYNYGDILSQKKPLTLLHSWVNFQVKHEFNPVHDHSGLFTFVIWLKIPYLIEDERKISPGSDSTQPLGGNFAFYYTDVLGKLNHYAIPADKSMEKTLLVFPAKLNHSVYPFYSSDDYRITISGNIGFLV